MDILLIAAVLGLIPALIANSKGRSFILWWIYG
ncbi:zinc ribbon domain-containing protein, partial [Xenorhabdus sp. psl]|nr:zinc ribbon domain-containing protein [Xenorhabdus sp. psl]